MAILVKGKTFTSTEQVTSTKLHQLVDSATFDPAAADGSTLEVSAGALRVKDSGVTTAKIADASVTGEKLGSNVVFGMKNRLINGAFNINQSGLTTAADAVYHLDQWYALTESGSVTIAQQTNQENGQPTSLRMTQPDVTAKRMGSAQPIESINCRDLRGQTVALRARVRCSSSQAIRWAVVDWTGTADAIIRDVVSSWTSTTFTPGNFFINTTTTIAATGSVTPAANTWTDLLASATISSSANNLIVFIWSEGTLAQNATLDLGAVQLAQGSQTPFEARPVGLELDLCRLYFRILGDLTLTTNAVGAYCRSSTTIESFGLPLSPRMRTTPSLAVVGTANFFNGAINTAVSSVAIVGSSPGSFSLSAAITGGTAGQAGQIYFNAGSYITLSAAL